MTHKRPRDVDAALSIQRTRMTLLLFTLLAAYVLWLVISWDCGIATAFNLQSDWECHMKIGETKVYVIGPTNAAGLPTPVGAHVFAVDSANYTVAVADDGLSVMVTAVEAGDGVLSVSGFAIDGSVIPSESKALPTVEAPPVDNVAVAFNLAEA